MHFRLSFTLILPIVVFSCAGPRPDELCLGPQVPPLTCDEASKRVAQLKGGQPFEFEGADGTPRAAFRFAPADSPKVLMIGLHGLTSHAGWLAPIARELARAGIETWTTDRLGTATSAGNHRGDVRDWRTWTGDVRLLIARAQQQYPGVRIVLWGYSLGGVVAAAYLAEAGDSSPVDHAILMAPGWATTQPHPASKPFLLGGSYLLPGFRIKPPVKSNLALADTLSVMKKDNSVTRSMTLRYLRNIHSMQSFANERLGQLDMRVTVLLAKCDTLVDNAAVRTLSQRMPQHKVVEVPGLGHMLVLEDAPRVARLLRDAILDQP